MTNAIGRSGRSLRVAFVVGACLSVAACGSYDDDSPGGTTPDAPATTPAPGTEPDYGY